MKNLLASAALTVGLSTAPALAQSNNTSPESKENSSQKIEVVKNTVCDKTRFALECEKAGLVLNPKGYVENQNNIEKNNNTISLNEVVKSSKDPEDALFWDLRFIDYTVSENDPAKVDTLFQLRDLFTNVIMSRISNRQQDWENKIMSLEDSPQKELILGFINDAIENIKTQFADQPNQLPTNVPQIYLEKAITASISSLLNSDKELIVNESQSEEFVLRYFTDLTVALYLKWDLSKDQIQVLEKDLWEWKVAYFSTFKLNNQTVQKLLAVTDFENAQKIVSAMNTVDKNTTVEEPEVEYVSFEWVNEEYIWDVEKYPLELQKIFMDIFNSYAPNLTWMPLDDLHYELTGTFNAVDNNPKRALEDAQYVKDTFGWDLSAFVEYAQNAKIEQDQRVAHHEKEMKQWEKELAEKDEQLAEKDEQLAAKKEQIAAQDEQIAALRKSQENARKILAMLDGN